MYEFTALRRKEIVSLPTGMRVGRIDDVEFDEKGIIQAFLIYARPRIFGTSARGRVFRISLSDIERIGDDVILIRTAP